MGFLKFAIIINVFVSSDSFEYLCYGSTAIRNIVDSYSAGIDLTTKVNPCAVRVNDN